MKKRHIELSVQNRSERIILPINPNSISVTRGQKNHVVDLLNMGEVLSMGNQTLQELSFSSFFPALKSPFFRYADRAPWEYIDTLDRWRLDRQVVRIIIGGTPVNLAVAIERLAPEMPEGQEDVAYSITLKEYRRLNVPMVQHQSAQSASGLLDRPDDFIRPAFVIVRSPVETFWYLACQYYGDGNYWRAIATANNQELAYDTHVGMVVVLP